ncbi:hypothetical protein ACFIOY_10975 [Bradyrhizobium sp. TZ2]
MEPDAICRLQYNMCDISAKVDIMATCETCGNDYDKAFQVTMSGKAHTFDSFECAIHALAPTCDHCGIRIVGHGLEKGVHFIVASIAPKAKALKVYAIRSSPGNCTVWVPSHPPGGIPRGAFATV